VLLASPVAAIISRIFKKTHGEWRLDDPLEVNNGNLKEALEHLISTCAELLDKYSDHWLKQLSSVTHWHDTLTSDWPFLLPQDYYPHPSPGKGHF